MTMIDDGRKNRRDQNVVISYKFINTQTPLSLFSFSVIQIISGQVKKAKFGLSKL